MMGMIRAKNDGEMGTAWKVAIIFAAVFMVATTIQDMQQSRKLRELEHKLEMITLGQKAQNAEERIKSYESMIERLATINANLEALERQRKGSER